MSIDGLEKQMSRYAGVAFWIMAMKWISYVIMLVLVLSHIDLWVAAFTRR